MKAAIYNPYWDTLGGGERYTISFAKAINDLGYQVDLEWKNENILEMIQDRFGIKLNNIRVVKSVNKGDGYDLCFWISDGSIPLLHSRNNLLHFQVPFKDVNGKSLLNKMKLFRIKRIIVNSNFTKKVIDREFGTESCVIYPPCDTSRIRPKRKENIILSVGRFSELLQSKRQDVLIDAFIRSCKKGLEGWSLVLAGGVDVGTGDLLDRLNKRSKGYPIRIIKSPLYKELLDLYGKSKIFWSAGGFGENESKDPGKVEHFGISVVESMAGGCVPIVFNAGGHKEIISDRVNGFLWRERSQLIRITKTLISDNKYLKSLSREAVISSKNFSYESFAQEVKKNLQ